MKNDIIKLLNRVLEKELDPIDVSEFLKKVLNKIAETCDGCPRNDIVLCSDCFPDHANHVTYTMSPFSPCVECGRYDKSLNKKYKADCYWFVSDPRQETKINMIQFFVLEYLRWRYGELNYDLKPPLGWSKYSSQSLLYKIKYCLFLKPRWVIERILFNIYGKSIKENWLKKNYCKDW